MPVYSKQTGKIVFPESDSDLNIGLSDGLLEFRGEKKIHVYRAGNPNDIFMMPIEELQYAHSEGYVAESAVKRELREYLEINSDMLGASKAFAGELANSLLFSVPEIIMSKTMDPMEWAKIKGLSEENTVGALGGDVTGSLMSMFLNPAGPVGTIASKVGVKLLAKRLSAAIGSKLSDKLAMKASREMLARIGKKTGGNILARGAMGTGKIAGDLVKGGFRGMDEMVPAAMAHAYFGDYAKTQEALTMGFLFGGVINSPLALTRSAQRIMPKGNKLAEVVGKGELGETPGQKAMVTGLSTITNMSDDQIRYALNNGERIANARQFGDIYSEFEGYRNTTFRELGQAQSDLNIATQTLKNARTTKTEAMKQMSDGPNKLLASRIEDDIFEVKSWYKLKTADADRVLSMNVPDDIIPRRPLMDAFDTEIKLLKKRAGTLNVEAVKKLNASKRTLQNIPEEMNGIDARKALQDIRDDISAETAKAIPNKSFTHAMFGISEEFSSSIKGFDTTGDYGKIMDEMSSKIDATTVFETAMKDEVSRLKVGATLAKRPEDWSATDIKREGIIHNFLRVMDDIDPSSREFYGKLPIQQRQANEYLRDIRNKKPEGNLSPENAFDKNNLPIEFANVRVRDRAFQKLKREADEMAPLIGANENIPMSEMKLRKFSDENKNISLDKAFDKFIKAHDAPHLRDDLKASVASDSLEKAKIHGSRLVNLATAVAGGIFGGPMGIVAGAIGGAMLDKHSGKMLKTIANSQMVKSLFNAETKLAKIADAVDDIPNGNWFTKGVKTGVKKTASKATLLRLTANATNAVISENTEEEKDRFGITKKKATEQNVNNKEFSLGVWKSIYHKYTTLEENPQALVNMIDDSTAQVAAGSPELAEAMGQQIMKATSYLSGEMPRPIVPDSPYVEKGHEWEPSDYDLDVFHQKVVAAQEPLTVIDALYAGEVTRAMIESLAAVYPSILEMIQQKLAETMAENPDALTYDMKIHAGYVLGVVLEPSSSPQSMSYYQKNFVEDPEDQKQSRPGGFTPNLKADPSALSTTSSKLTGGLSE